MDMMFYNYDTRGASVASQLINFERMVKERDDTIARLQSKCEQSDARWQQLKSLCASRIHSEDDESTAGDAATLAMVLRIMSELERTI